MDRRRFLAAATTLVAAPSFGAPVRGKKGVVKIVSSLPRTGSAKGQTDTIVNGIKMAIGDYKGEVAGYKIEYTDWDDATPAQGQWDASKEADNARTAVADPDVVAVIGPYNSGAAKVSIPILNKAGLIQISPSCTWPGLTKKHAGDDLGEPDVYRRSGKITFARVCPTDFVQGPLAADFARDELKAGSVYVLDDKELYGAAIALGFRKRCEELKVKVLGHDGINVVQQNFVPLLKKIAGLKPDLVYFGGTTQSKGSQIALDAAQVGLICPLMFPDGCYEKAFIEAAGGDALDGRCYVTFGGVDVARLPTRAGANFVAAYRTKYRSDPEPYAVYGYEAARVVFAAIKAVDTKDREAIRKAVLATKDFDGALGKWSFDADGDTTLRQITVSKIAKGMFVPVKSVTAK